MNVTRRRGGLISRGGLVEVCVFQGGPFPLSQTSLSFCPSLLRRKLKSLDDDLHHSPQVLPVPDPTRPDLCIDHNNRIFTS